MTDIDRIEQLGQARNTAIQALADITKELRTESLEAIKGGIHRAHICTIAEIPTSLLDNWIAEYREGRL